MSITFKDKQYILEDDVIIIRDLKNTVSKTFKPSFLRIIIRSEGDIELGHLRFIKNLENKTITLCNTKNDSVFEFSEYIIRIILEEIY